MPQMPVNEVLSVSGLTELLREAIEPEFAQVWVQGEVSNFRRQDSGHCYFSLKDEGAQIPCVLFRREAAMLEFPLGNGVKLAAFGRISIYAPRGTYQLICQLALPTGRGSLAEQFEKLRRKLEAEGLFNPERKLPLPSLPRSVGIITSPTGAALRDFLSILARRGWRGRVVVLPARVQGAEAAGEIADRVRLAGESGLFDVLVLARGGGSLEDLWPFNEEEVARAVAACPIPTISGIGHETDFTLCDFAASRRAETPSGAAELLSSLRLDAQDRVDGCAEEMRDLLDSFIERMRARLALGASKLAVASPVRRIERENLRLDDLSGQLRHHFTNQLRDRREHLHRIEARAATSGPERTLELVRQKLAQIALRLDSVSPQSVLKRGFAMVSREDGSLVQDTSAMFTGEKLHLCMRDGERKVTVDDFPKI